MPFRRFLHFDLSAQTGSVGAAAAMEEVFTEETLAKARTAKIYIEHLYKVQSQNVKERRDR